MTAASCLLNSHIRIGYVVHIKCTHKPYISSRNHLKNTENFNILDYYTSTVYSNMITQSSVYIFRDR